uniref:Phenylacetate-coenzyme A ligase n=1 Tax=uncultured bacterium contig00045 TaxID=1181531 RepID=A0A806KI15_9BACT|nr:phenylacetate-coenzyme A ligase [uncultured bacterium contig00045]
MSQSKYFNEYIETLPRAELEALQLESLREIVRFSYEKSPHYKRAFDEVGVRPDSIKTLADLAKFPYVDKKTERDTQGVGSFLGEMCCVPESEVVFVSASSGSTGVPTLSPFTKTDFDEWQDVESRLFYMTGMRNTDRYVHALNFTLFVGGPDVIGAQNLGALCIWAGTVPSERLLFILKEFGPTFIWTTPSYAWYLGETAKKSGIDPAKDLSIKTIIVAGEAGGSIPATRQAIETLWGADLYDFFGISDIFGACAGMCEAKDGLHIAEDHILVETVDIHTGEVLPDGENGELVLTTLRKHARPMIRFRTGDIGFVRRERCSCGRTHARISIVGRKDDMFIVSGVNIFPSDVEFVIRGLEGITGEYLIRVSEKNYTARYAVEIEKARDNPETDEQLSERVSSALKARIGVKPAGITVLQDGELPRATHKAKRLIDERNLSFNI